MPRSTGPNLPELLPLASVPAADVEALLDAAFGADRHGRTAYRVREGLSPLDGLSFAKVEDGRLVGAIQCWPVQLDGDDGTPLPLVMVGPVAVAPDRQGTGIGHILMQRAIVAAGEDAPLMLVGDAPYYARFGFTAQRTGGWRLPGPYDQARLLARGNVPVRSGILAPRLSLVA
ncbi:MAG: N-acetyltransferase [Sphingomonas paucimobilis]